MKRIFTVIFTGLIAMVQLFGRNQPIDSLAMRVTAGTSKDRILFRITPPTHENDSIDFFNIIPLSDSCILIEGNNPVSQAVGLNHYLKYVAGIHVNWNNPEQPLPAVLPLPVDTITRSTSHRHRYYLNYCTFSYSMPFWDEERWMQEIDWMALHGINMPLSLTGAETVWKNLLERLGYTFDEITDFISGPAYFAWWHMNNLEGWGGPLPQSWFTEQTDIQKKILSRMKSLGMNAVLPGYSGMVPRNFTKKTRYKATDTGKWCGFNRPAFLSPDDHVFRVVADLYYEELEKLYGSSAYYSMDPFHEGGNSSNVDLSVAGHEIYSAMKRANPDAKWVIQSWQSNPRKAMTDTIPAGDLIVLDLYSEKIPKWENIGGYGPHHWLYCMLLNFGGNIGMHGRINEIIDGFNRASTGIYGTTLKGIGATPEGIENNPIMYELLFELPWIDAEVDADSWINQYLGARYGNDVPHNVREAWKILASTVYNAPVNFPGQGTVESLICARPSWLPKSASTWGCSELFYSPDSTAKAALLMAASLPVLADNKNFMYDFIDISRQANADKANRLLHRISDMHNIGKTDSVGILAAEFLKLMLQQDSLLSILPDTHVDSWLSKAAKRAGNDPKLIEQYVGNAAMLITVWGDSIAANRGGLHDYSHREWGGIIKDLYYNRWKAFFDHELYGAPEPDYYQMEKDWIERSKKKYLDSTPK